MNVLIMFKIGQAGREAGGVGTVNAFLACHTVLVFHFRGLCQDR